MLLNADLGESEPEDRTEALMRVIDLANVACGGHAGNSGTMRRCVRLAAMLGVRIGAHPGLASDFGRGCVDMDAKELHSLVTEQASALAALTPLHHIKLHGALYHAVETSQILARTYVEAVASVFPGISIVAFAGGHVLPIARQLGIPALAEVFADRDYREDGTLVPRGEPGALLVDPAEVVARLPTLRGDTICVHADSPNALAIACAVRAVL